MFRRIAIYLLFASLCVVAKAQKSNGILVAGKDTIAYRYTPINTASPKRKVDLTFAPGLYYSPSTSAGLAIMAAGRYRLGGGRRVTPESNFSVYAAASLTGFYRLGAKGANIFGNDTQRIIYNAEFFSQPTYFWGVGYDAAMQNEQVRYLASRTVVDLKFLQRVAKGLFVGVGTDYNYHYGGFGGKRYVSEEKFLSMLDGEGIGYNATGISLFVEFDTRDAITKPQRGIYIGIQTKVRPKGMNNIGRSLWSGRLSANYYQRLWKGAVLAFDLQAELNSEGIPWVYNASLGGLSSMRGYYAGRFNDLCSITLQAELRQKIYKGLGAAAWGGAGNVFHSFRTFAWRETLPTYGVGLRYSLKRNLSFRLDYGFGGNDGRGKLIHGAVFSINEAF